MAVCRGLADAAEVQIPGLLADLDTEFLHDFRVAVRRSRSVVKEMRTVLSDDECRLASEGLRWLQQLTGPTRDLDVMLLDLPTRTADLSDVFGDEAMRLAEVLTQRRQKAQRALVRGVQGNRFEATWSGWRALLEAPESARGPRADDPVGAVAGERLQKLYRRMVKSGEGVPPDAPSEVSHDLRKQGKELRYMLELFGPLWPQRDVQPLVNQLKGLQDVLGRFHDGQVQAAWLRSLAGEIAKESPRPNTSLLIGAVVDRLSSDGRDILTNFPAKFAPFSSPTTRKLVAKTFTS
jgi:CHAD domain-containing protein